MIRSPRTSAGWPRLLPPLLALALLVALVALACGDDGDDAESLAEPLRIGFLHHIEADAVDPLASRHAANLAIKHINQAGGVLGRPVQIVYGDSTYDPETAVTVARRLIAEEGVHAMVGPGTSATTIAVAEQVTIPARIPTISASATAPRLAALDDDDFLFRTSLSDASLGPVVAQLALDLGFDRVGVVYRDDAWGQGLAESFRQAWRGVSLVAVPADPNGETFVDELRESAADGARALVLITFTTQTKILLQEALAGGFYDRFLFTEGTHPEVIEAVGVEALIDQRGVSPALPEGDAARLAWEANFREEYGYLPDNAYFRAQYDAVIAIALAAEAAGSLEGAAIRDQLRAVASAPGETLTAGPEGVAEAFRIVRAGGEVDFEGAATTIEWDDNGDIRRGYVGVWRFTEEGVIETIEVVPYEH